ncbi:MAG TPA: carbohydrate ABC transporter permease, partial [Clostridia bacterium]|nr:carbohydrate ABC transporter permease [Clostridia bacterium]
MASRSIRHTASDRVFLGFVWVALTLFFIIIAYPLAFIVSASFSGGMSSLSLSLLPQRFSVEGYRAVFEYRWIWVGYRNSLFYLVVGTLLSLAVTVCCAYPLSRSDFAARKFVMALCVFTMYFSGGLIPTYLLVKQLGLTDSPLAILLPGALSVYNMIVMRTYFATQIPMEMREASQLDGCGDLRFLTRIVLPLSVPVLAVIGLYYAVSIWNSYFQALIYLQSRDKLPLTIFLREILILNTAGDLTQSIDLDAMASMEARQNVM